MYLISVDTAWQLAEDRRQALTRLATRRRRPRPPVDPLPGPPDWAA